MPQRDPDPEQRIRAAVAVMDFLANHPGKESWTAAEIDEYDRLLEDTGNAAVDTFPWDPD